MVVVVSCTDRLPAAPAANRSPIPETGSSTGASPGSSSGRASDAGGYPATEERPTQSSPEESTSGERHSTENEEGGDRRERGE